MFERFNLEPGPYWEKEIKALSITSASQFYQLFENKVPRNDEWADSIFDLNSFSAGFTEDDKKFILKKIFSLDS